MPSDRKTYCTYIIGSLSGTLYIGMTSNSYITASFQHKFHRIEGFTDKYQVERLLYRESFDDVHKAINREKQLKGWRRSKKIALIESVNPTLAGSGKRMVSRNESSQSNHNPKQIVILSEAKTCAKRMSESGVAHPLPYKRYPR